MIASSDLPRSHSLLHKRHHVPRHLRGGVGDGFTLAHGAPDSGTDLFDTVGRRWGRDHKTNNNNGDQCDSRNRQRIANPLRHRRFDVLPVSIALAGALTLTKNRLPQ